MTYQNQQRIVSKVRLLILILEWINHMVQYIYYLKAHKLDQRPSWWKQDMPYTKGKANKVIHNKPGWLICVYFVSRPNTAKNTKSVGSSQSI